MEALVTRPHRLVDQLQALAVDEVAVPADLAARADRQQSDLLHFAIHGFALEIDPV